MKLKFGMIVGIMFFGLVGNASELCKVMIEMSDAHHSLQIAQSIRDVDLASRELQRVSVKAQNENAYDYLIQVEDIMDSKQRVFLSMSATSTKLLKLVYGGGKVRSCNQDPLIYSSSAVLNKSYAITAQQLVSGMVSCELLKKLENEKLAALKCSR